MSERAGDRSADPRALETLFDANHRVLLRVAMRVLADADQAEDVVQETFVRAAVHLDRIPATSSGAQAWLVRVAVNLCRDRHRREAVRSRWSVERPDQDAESLAESASRGPAAEGGSPSTEARLTVGALLRRLPTRRRAILVLHELEGWSVAEIAASLGLRRVTVRWHLAAARRDLARWLDAGPDRRGERR